MNAKDAETLKQLETRRQMLEAETAALKSDFVRAELKWTDAEKRLAGIEKKIEDIKERNSKPVVTEHAILKYLEYAKGVDLSVIAQEILSEETAKRIMMLGSGKYPIGGGMKAVVKGRAIVSLSRSKRVSDAGSEG